MKQPPSPGTDTFSRLARVALRAADATAAAVFAGGTEPDSPGALAGRSLAGAELLGVLRSLAWTGEEGGRFVLEDVLALGGRDETDIVRGLSAAGLRSCAAVARPGGATTVWVGSTEPRLWSEELLSLMEDVAALAEAEVGRASAEAGPAGSAGQDAGAPAGEGARRPGEHEFQALVEDAPDVIVRFDADGQVTYCNPVVQRYTGRRPEEIVSGWQRPGVFAPELLAEWRHALGQVYHTGRPITIEFDMDSADGRRRFECRIAPHIGPDGHVESALAIGRDITELKRVEAALRASEAQVRGIVDGAAVGIWLMGLDGRFIRVNPALAEMLGYAQDELVGKHFREVTLAEDLACTGEMHERLCAGERTHDQIMTRQVRADGTVLCGRLTTSVVTRDDGRLIVGMMEDVTAHRAAEEALRESEARFRSLIEHSSDIIGITDEDGRIRYVSPSVRTVLGYEPEPMIGQKLAERVHPDDLAAAREVRIRALESPGEVVTVELRVQHADGSWHTFRVRLQSRLDDPAVRGIVINSLDITTARRLEAQLLQSQKMEAVGRLAGGVAHDFNNILTAVQGHATLLSEELPPDSPLRADVEQIQRSAERAASLTRHLLAFSRLQMLQPKVLDVNAIVVETQKMLLRLIGEDVELVTRLDPEIGRIRADPAQVQQILMNLVVNARDAMPSGGRVEIRTGHASFDQRYTSRFGYTVAPGRYVLLAVSDTGSGIAPDVLDHIFEPFFTTKEVGRGTGLGLSSVYGTVKQSGGYIWVDTTPGTGCTFRVYLPEVDESPDESEAAPAPVPSGSGVIMLVEDEPAVRALARRVLERAGYDVLEAADGEAALRVCEEHEGPIDLVLTDVVMPRLGGGELATRVGALRPQTRVLLMSGYTQDTLARRGVAGGASFLNKPFSPELLRQAVREALQTPEGPPE